ncbi:MAG: hypothetical protein JOY92_16880 [Verrucomicrobia bacterium]|nr:hypothetical protein [Verrucomicrobiota bacterium]
MIPFVTTPHPATAAPRWPGALGIGALLFLLCSVPAAQAQEPVRASLSRALGNPNFEPYTESALLRFGPVQGNLDAGVSLYYTDNASLSNTSTSSRLQLNENLNLDLLWPFTIHNSLHLRLGASIGQVLVGTGGDRFSLALAPDSEISWALGVGDFRIRLYDRFAVIQDPTTDPTVTHVFDLNRFRNDAGTTIDWDLNKLVLTLLVDDTYVTQSARTDNQVPLPSITNGDRNTIRASLQAAYQLTPTVSFGPSFSASESSGTSATEIDAISPGAFLKMQLTRLTSFQLEGGMNFFSTRYPDVGVIFLNQQRLPTSDYYISAVLKNQVTRFINLSVSVSHDLDYADGLTATKRTLVSVGANYRVNKRVWIDLGGYYEDGTVLSPLNGGDYSRFSFSAGMTCRLGPKLTTALQYRHTQRAANNGGFAFVSDGHLFTEAASQGSYNQNEISLSVNYAF